MTDEAIIALYFDRNEQAIEETRVKYGAYCYEVARRIVTLHEDAEECVSDTYLAAWNAMPPTWPKVLRLFLAKITRSRAINRWQAARAKKRGEGETAVILDELEECVADPAAASPEMIVETKELARCLDAFLLQLPERDRHLFVRRYFYAEPVEEIAQRTGLSAGNVSVILHRVRAKLKGHLEKEGYVV